MPRPCPSPAMPCRQGFRLCLSHLIYTVRSCLIHTCCAMTMPRACRAPTLPFWKRLHGIAGEKHGRGMGTACYVWISLWETQFNTSWFLFVGFLKNGVYVVKIRNMAQWEEWLLEAIEQIWQSLHGKKWYSDWTNAGPLKMHVWNVITVRPKLFDLHFNLLAPELFF